MDLMTSIEGLKQLKEVVIILLIVHLSERIPVQALKQYLTGVSKTFMMITDLYKREKEFLNEETDEFLKLTKRKGQQRRAQRV